MDRTPTAVPRRRAAALVLLMGLVSFAQSWLAIDGSDRTAGDPARDMQIALNLIRHGEFHDTPQLAWERSQGTSRPYANVAPVPPAFLAPIFNAAADAILESLDYETVVVPGNWAVEVVDALAVGVQTGSISEAGVQGFVTLLETLGVLEHACEPTSAIDRRISLCRDHGLASHDAAYLDLAMREDLPLATFERTLRHAAGNTGVKLVPSDDA